MIQFYLNDVKKYLPECLNLYQGLPIPIQQRVGYQVYKRKLKPINSLQVGLEIKKICTKAVKQLYLKTDVLFDLQIDYINVFHFRTIY